MNRTALYNCHIQTGAQMTEFAGWQMPLFYSGIREEHLAVRSSCGIFDASHMGEIEITGPQAGSLCQWLVTGDVARMDNGRVRYSLLCNEAGGILDDLMIYRFSAERFLFCVNASNTKRDFEWMVSNSRNFDAEVRDLSARFSLVSIQGPDSEDVMRHAADPGAELPGRFSFLNRGDGFISRTGYTGEDGFEFFVPWDDAPGLWLKIFSSRNPRPGTAACGLGCRDTLRLEMGYALYGNEIGEDINPFEASLGRYVNMEKGDFCGRKSLETVLENGVRRILCGIEMVEPGIPRSSYKVFCANAEAGFITSGTMSPSLGRPVGLAMIDVPALETARRDGVEIQIRNKRRKAVIADFPFHKRNGNSEQLKYREELN